MSNPRCSSNVQNMEEKDLIPFERFNGLEKQIAGLSGTDLCSLTPPSVPLSSENDKVTVK